jgi:hypothetical protein
VRRSSDRPAGPASGDLIPATPGEVLDCGWAQATGAQISPIGAAQITVSTRHLAVQNGGSARLARVETGYEA